MYDDSEGGVTLSFTNAKWFQTQHFSSLAGYSVAFKSSVDQLDDRAFISTFSNWVFGSYRLNLLSQRLFWWFFFSLIMWKDGMYTIRLVTQVNKVCFYFIKTYLITNDWTIFDQFGPGQHSRTVRWSMYGGYGSSVWGRSRGAPICMLMEDATVSAEWKSQMKGQNGKRTEQKSNLVNKAGAEGHLTWSISLCDWNDFIKTEGTGK